MTDSPTTVRTTGEAGAYTRTILERQLADALQDLATATDVARDYVDEQEAAQLLVNELEAAIADLDDTRRRSADLARVITSAAAVDYFEGTLGDQS